MISRVTNFVFRSRSSKDGGSVSKKRPRAVSCDSAPSKSKENAKNGSGKNGSGQGNAERSSVAVDANRPPLKEVEAPARHYEIPASIELRQQEEKDFIRRNDTSEASVWYLVDVKWLQEWKTFVTRTNAPTVPGPIDNSRLLDRATGGSRPGLRPVDDYRGVNGAIWTFWQQRYGGGPAVMRRELDLYAAQPREDDPSLSTSSDAGSSERPVVSPAAPGVAPAGGRRPEPARAGPSDNTGSGFEWDEGRKQEPGSGSSPARGRATDTKGRSSTSSNRTASAPAKDRANDEEDEAPKKAACCDKCDGPHMTDDCPHFRRPREKHADAWTSYGKKATADSKEIVHVVRNARVVRQPGDGSCLFHSLSYGLSDRSTASSLRRDICRYVESNPDISIADTSLKDWIRYDSGDATTVQSYAQRMSSGTWGGGIEMAALTKMKPVNVHVYEKCEEGYRRISKFDNPNAAKTISVLYQGRMHYDAIEVN